MSKHTQEPWSVYGDGIDGENDSHSEKQVVSYKIENPADARRIVACVNACTGISTENLEQNKPIKEGLHGLNERIRTTEQQRDELLAALQEIARYPGKRYEELGYAGARELARKTVEKVKDGAI